MKPQTFGLVSDSAIADFVNFVNPIWRDLAKNGTPIIVKVSTKNEEITNAQRRLYWFWVTQFANHVGNDKDEQHHDFKRRFLIALYRRDDAGFAAMCDSIAKLKTSEPEEFQSIGDQVIRLTSITKATKYQMTEFMDSIYRFCSAQGCGLRVPDDLRYLREMREQNQSDER